MLNELPRSPPHPTPDLAAVEALLGGFMPHDGRVQTQAMHRLVQTDRELQLWRVSVGAPAWIGWTLTVVWPGQTQRCPVLLSPDGGWPHVLSDGAVSAVLAQQTALAHALGTPATPGVAVPAALAAFTSAGVSRVPAPTTPPGTSAMARIASSADRKSVV